MTKILLTDTSAASFATNGLSPTNSGYHSTTDKTPSPITSNIPQPLVSPTASGMSVASMVSPTSPSIADPRRFDRPNSIESTGPASSHPQDANAVAFARRESVDSRINQGISDMRLGNSPYASNNQSTTSILDTLHSQRNPRPGLENLSVHRISNGYQPSAERNPDSKTIRTAPAITGPATGNIARAAEPIKGQAWAFPEEEVQRASQHYEDSRRSSITESVASSQFTVESRLPPGQRRLEDASDYARMSNASDFPPVHHHTMQHKQLSELQQEEASSPSGAQPYSRTPELRISHKLAERKRRTEMKDLFDQLRDLMPQERGSKASKWEILTKGKSMTRSTQRPVLTLAAIAEHQKQSDHIRELARQVKQVSAENDMLRHQLLSSGVRMGEMPPPNMHGGPGPQGPPPQAAAPQHYPPEAYGQARTELPPLRSLNPAMPNGPDTMSGVQYEAPRVNGNGFRPEHRY